MERSHLAWFFALCAVSAVSGRGIVTDECVLGPKFWCQNLVTAIQCGAVDHCKDTAWTGVDVLCLECKQIVSILETMVKKSSLQDTVKAFLHKQCSYIRVNPLVVECNRLVDQYANLIIAFLEKEINPGTVCSTLKLCPSDQSEHIWNNDLFQNMIIENILPFIQKNVYNAHVKSTQGQNENGEWPLPLPLCWMCKSFVGRIESLIPKTALAHSASQLCRLLPAKIAGVCQCLVEKYTIIILDMILNKLGPQLLCRLVFMCSTNENCEADLPVIPSLDSDLSCDTCLVVTSWIKPTLSYNMTHAEVEAAMRRAHNETALQWNGGQTFLQKHHSELSVILHKQWDQMKTCQALGACQTLVNASPENSGCAAGPSYWCQNLETAKKCEAVDHCLKYMWH